MLILLENLLEATLSNQLNHNAESIVLLILEGFNEGNYVGVFNFFHDLYFLRACSLKGAFSDLYDYKLASGYISSFVNQSKASFSKFFKKKVMIFEFFNWKQYSPNHIPNKIKCFISILNFSL